MGHAKLINNERKACDAVARCLELINEHKRSDARSPEDDRIGPPVEYVFNLGGTTYALEHTIVEAFSGQIRTDVDFGKFIEPIVNRLDGKLPPPGVFEVAFEIYPTKDFGQKEISSAQNEVADWIYRTALELHAEHPDQLGRDHDPNGFRNSRTGSPANVDVRLSREVGWWKNDRHSGRLYPLRIAPRDYESLRVERLGVAMEKKLPKLAQWKYTGATSVLVLENRDIALSNHFAIFEALKPALSGRADAPDHVWLVDTGIEQEWTVWCLIRNGVDFPDEDGPKRFWEFNPEDLTSV